jgi:hypothetical protein
MRQLLTDLYTKGRRHGENALEIATDIAREHPLATVAGAGAAGTGGIMILQGDDEPATPVMIEQDPIGYDTSTPPLTAEDLKRQIDYYGKRIGTDQLTLMTLRDQYAQMGGQV